MSSEKRRPLSRANVRSAAHVGPAGVTCASIYPYFPNREAIVDAVAAWYLAAFRTEQAESLERAFPCVIIRTELGGIDHVLECRGCDPIF